MKHMRITTAHQSITFSRRMMLLGGAQAAVGGLLIGRMGWLAIAQNQKYQLLSESNRVQLIPVPPRRGWIIDRNGKPIAINKASFRVDLIPQQIADGPKVIAELQRLMSLPPDEVERITRELAASRGFQPVSVADNVPYEQYAAITVRLPDLPGVAASRGFTRFYPGGSTVGQLVGYVGAASATEYEKENKNPLLLIPGVKIGKEGLEQTLESDPSGRARRTAGRGDRARQAGQGARSQAGPQRRHRPADDRFRPSPICGAADRRPVLLGRRAGRDQRRHPRHALDAVVRSEQLL